MVATKHARNRLPLQTPVARQPHPALGIGHAYSHDFRLFSNYLFRNFNDQHLIIRQAQRMYLFPSDRTIRRHALRSRTLGHLRRWQWTGNSFATVLRGINNYMLAYWRSIWPKSTHAEMNALLFNSQIASGQPNPRFFCPSQISRAEDRLGLSGKRGSTTAYQALLPRNVIKRWIYWNRPYPEGISDIPKDDWIDYDEAAIFVETSNRASGMFIYCHMLLILIRKV